MHISCTKSSTKVLAVEWQGGDKQLRKLVLITLLTCFSGASLAACERELDAIFNTGKAYKGKAYSEYEAGWRKNHNLFLTGAKLTSHSASSMKNGIEDIKKAMSRERGDQQFGYLNTIAEWDYLICTLSNPTERQTANRQFQSGNDQPKPLQESNSTNTQQPFTQNQSTQQQSQQAQQQAQQTQQLAAQNQARADQTRKSERRRHEPENEAHDCLSLDKSGLFGGIVNKCDFKVAYQFCNFNPKKDSWAESHTCGKSGGADFVGAGRTSAAHVKNTETVYWFACKDPAWPVDVEYVAGKGIQARCYTIGGK